MKEVALRLARLVALVLPVAVAVGIGTGVASAPPASASSCPAASTPSGSGTYSDPYLISSPADLQWFHQSGPLGGVYHLTDDIEMTGCTWTRGIGGPVSGLGTKFSGLLDGKGHDIRGLSVSNNTSYATGFFWISRGTVRNVGLVDLSVTSTSVDTGGIAGVNEGLIQDSYVTGEINGTDRTGGLVGRTTHPFQKIEASWFSGSVSGNNGVGGIVGRLGTNRDTVDIEDVSVSGSVTATDRVGGIVGEAGDLSNGTNNGNGNPNIADAVNYADISGQNNVGGIAGWIQGEFNFSGTYIGEINRAVNYGTVTGASQVGGIVGRTDDIMSMENLSQYGSITGTVTDIGGILGLLDVEQCCSFRLTLQDTMSLGSVTGPDKATVGPVVGKMEEQPLPSDYGRSLWSTDAISLLSNQNSNGVSASDDDLRLLTTYSNRSFSISDCTSGQSTTWLQCSGEYPYVRQIGVLDIPNAPDALTGVVSSQQIELSWQNNGSTSVNPTTSHSIEYKTADGSWASPEGSIETSSSKTAYTLSGLTNGVTYDVRITATNAFGTSQASSVVSFDVADVPSPPRSVTVDSVDDQQATVSWTAPSSEGGSAISGYRVSFSTDDGQTWTYVPAADSTNTSTVVTGLTNGTEYRFRVVATNSDGSSSPSDPSDSTVVGIVPGSPTGLQIAQRFADSIELEWTAPATGTGAITSNRLEYSTDSGASWTPFDETFAGSATQGTITGLTEGTSYLFRVVASNVVGDSDPSETLAAVVGLTSSAPQDLQVTVEYDFNAITMEFEAPASPGSADIESYSVEVNINDGGWEERSTFTDDLASVTRTFAGWNTGDSIQMRVYATTSIGDGAVATAEPVSFIGATTQPTGVFSLDSDGALTVYWNEPTSLNGSTIAEYKIEYSTDGGQNWLVASAGTGSTSRSFAHAASSDGQRYSYRIAAVTTDGLISPWSSTSSPSIVSSCQWSAPPGSGNLSSPYLLSTPGHLEFIRQDPDRWSSVYRLTNDIDMSDCGTWRVTIGDAANPFEGVVFGEGSMISGLDVDLGSNDFAGLFGYLGYTDGKSTIVQLAVEGSVTGGEHVGGLAGFVEDGVVLEEVATAVDVTGSSSVGGLVGELAGAISHSYSLSPVSASSQNAGGLVGSLGANGIVLNSYANGTVSSAGVAGGLIATVATGATVTDSYWNTETSSLATSAAGTGKTTAQLREPATFANWSSFTQTCDSTDSMWKLCSNDNFGYPRLGSVQTPGDVTVPTGVTAEAGDGSALVTWNASAAGAHFPVTSYIVTASPGGATCTASTGEPITTSCTVTGLSNAQLYSFTVAATNALGTTTSSFEATATPIGPSDFISVWRTTADGQTITLPLLTSFDADYDFIVNWGDGEIERVTSADLPATHTFAQAGTYTVRMSGTLVGWSFGEVPESAQAIQRISQWGSFAVSDNVGGAFEGATNLVVTAPDAPDLSRALILDRFFKNASSLATPDLTSWDFSNVLSVSSFFEGASSFNADISAWDTSNLQTMNNFLKGATNFDQDLSSWDVSSLTSAIGFLDGVTLEDYNYEALLVGWSSQDLPDRTVGFSGGNSIWQAGGTSGNARAALTAKGWNITDGGGKPSAPLNLTVTPVENRLFVDWDPPAQDGGQPILRYTVRVTSDVTGWAYPVATEVTLTGQVGETYSIQVLARNSTGDGPLSEAVSGTVEIGTPTAPSSISVTRGDGQLDLAFEIESDGGADITTVEYSFDGTTNWTAVDSLASTSDTSYTGTISGLTNGTSYNFFLRASNGTKTSSTSTMVSGTPATTPTAPTISAAAGSEGFTLSLLNAADGRGSDITGYQYRIDTGAWQDFGGFPVTVGGLVNGTTYSVVARAVNGVGPGELSTAVSVTPEAAAATAPSAPSSVIATRGDQRIDFTFEIATTGGGSITAVEYSLDGGIDWLSAANFSNTAGSSYAAAITGLTNGTEYSILLRAKASEDWSEASSAVTATPATTPDAPRVTVTSSDADITVALDGLDSDGGSSVIRYEYRVDSGSWITVGSFPLSLTDNAPGTYTVAVRAVNAVGNGAVRNSSVEVVASPDPDPEASPAPGQVTGLRGTSGNASINLTWDAPSGTVTDYQVNTGNGWSNLNSTSTAVTVTGVTNGTSYSVSVRAMNGTSAGTASSSVTVVPGVPGAVINLSATPADSAIELTWTAPDSGAAAIDNYEYSIDDGLTWSSTSSASTSYRIEGLSSDATYSLRVRAVNVHGPGPASDTVTESPQDGGGGGSEEVSAPSAPRNVTFTAGGSSIAIAWDEPASDGGSPITSYQVLYVIDGQQDVTSISISDPTARSYTITGLQAGQRYQVGVGAVNDEGNGEGVTDTLTVGDAPAAPRDLEAEPGNQSVDLTWSAPATGSSAITDHEYSIDNGDTWASLATTGTSATVTGLTNGTDYTFTIRAVNSTGPGEASSSVTQRPGVPKAPSSVNAQVSSDAVELEWSEPEHHGIGIDRYEITVTQLSGRALIQRSISLTNLTARAGSYTTTFTSYTLTGMSGGAYRISVRAINNYGPGVPAVTSIGSIPAEDDEWIGPAPHVQQFAAPIEPTPERCAAFAPTDLNWSGVPSGGWGVSWAQWVNGGLGGAVCTRTLVYDRWQDWWELAA